MSDGLLFLTAFLACAVEMVEALTIVLAAGVARGWRSALAGAGSAIVVLGAAVAAFGPALAAVPLDAVRLVVGGLLLLLGLQWLRKAVLRAAGRKSQHDEEAIYAAELAEAQSAGARVRAGVDAYGFTLAFKGVLLEGLEVVVIVIAFGSAHAHIAPAVAGAAAAFVVVATVGVLVRAPLARVPENALKFAVGVLLTSFGVFWLVEGAGVHWPGGDAVLPVAIVFVTLGALALVWVLRRRPAPPGPQDAARTMPSTSR